MGLLLLDGPGKRALTLSGNEITDASRALAVQGDGLLNDSSFGVWEATTNLCTNGGFETNTTGWTAGGTNTLAASADRAKFGAKSGKATYANNATLADYAATITNTAHTASCWIYIPTAYDGVGVELRQLNYTVAASAAAANMAIRDTWQRLTLTFTPGVDVIGNIQVNNTGAAPTAGRFIYVDGVQIEATTFATPYVETNGATAARTAARVQFPASLLDETQGWVALRLRAGFPSTDAAYKSLFSWQDSATNRIEWNRNTVNEVTGARYAGGVGADGAILPLGAFSVGEFLTVIGAWTATEFKSSLGGAFTSTPNNTIPVLAATVAEIGFEPPFSLPRMNSDILWFACGTGTLSDSDAAAIHAFGNNDRGLSAFPGNPTGFWSAANGVMEVRA